jgi:hypothetical protein
MLDKSFTILLASLAVIALSLIVILHFSPLSEVNELTGMVLFITAACLLVAGYALAIIALAFVGVFALTEFWQRNRK